MATSHQKYYQDDSLSLHNARTDETLNFKGVVSYMPPVEVFGPAQLATKCWAGPGDEASVWNNERHERGPLTVYPA